MLCCHRMLLPPPPPPSPLVVVMVLMMCHSATSFLFPRLPTFQTLPVEEAVEVVWNLYREAA